jgi:transposase
MLYVSIDQHRKQLTVCVRDEEGNVILRRQVSTEWKRVRAFLAELRERAGEGGFVVILEVCGFNDWLLKLLAEYGCRETVLVQPEKRSKRKTDRRDANALGEILWVNRQRLLGGKRIQGIRRVELPTPEEAADRQVTMLRKRLGQARTRTVNRVKHLLRKHNLERECPTKGLDTIKAKKWMSGLSLDEVDRLELDLLLVQWEQWDRQIERVEKEIERRQPKNPKATVLATIPGGGAYSSLAVASRIGRIERFARPESLANYWGLTPGCRNSGEATDRLGSITKQGSAMVRFILGQWVVHVLRKDPAMRKWYKEIKKRRGAKIARVAVMRRLATVIWHMVKHNQPYQIGGLRGRSETAAPPAEPKPEGPGTETTTRGDSAPETCEGGKRKTTGKRTSAPKGCEKGKRKTTGKGASLQGFRRPPAGDQGDEAPPPGPPTLFSVAAPPRKNAGTN